MRKEGRPGFSLAETLVTVVVAIFIVALFASSFVASRATRESKATASVGLFLRDALERARSLPSSSLTARTNGKFPGLAYNLGRQTVVPFSGAVSSPNALAVQSASEPFADGLSSVALLPETGFGDVAYGADFQVDPSSASNWRVGLLFGYADSEKYEYVSISPNAIQVRSASGGVEAVAFTQSRAFATGSWYRLQVSTSGANASVYLDGALVTTVAGFASYGHLGVIGFNASTYLVDDVTLTSTYDSPAWTYDASVGNGSLSATDDTDLDFDQGVFTGTALNGQGAPAAVALDTFAAWTDATSPTNANFRSVSQVGASAWAVASGGIIARWNGTSWATQTSPTNKNLNAVDMLSATDGWAVADNGVIIRWNGTSWATVTSPTTKNLAAVSMVSATDGWAVADNGTIIRWNGTSWATVTSPTTANLNAVSMTSSTDGWAGGDNGVLIRWNGTSWSTAASPTTKRLNGLEMLSSTDGWAVADTGVIIRWNGTSWATVTSPVTTNLKAVSLDASNDGWAAGDNGVVVLWNGTSWSSDSTPANANMKAVSLLSPTDGWAVADSGKIERYGLQYLATGGFLSEIIDGGPAAKWVRAAWTAAVPSGSSVTLATRSGDTPAPDGAWSGFSAELTNSASSSVTSPMARYLQYRLSFASTTGAAGASVDNVVIGYTSPLRTVTWNFDAQTVGAFPDGFLRNAPADLTGLKATMSITPVSGTSLIDLTASATWTQEGVYKTLRYETLKFQP